MTQTQKRLLFWLPFAGLLAGGAALWWLVLGPRFPEGNGIYFVAGPLWGWMGLAHLLGFFPRKEDCPPPLRVRLCLSLAMLCLCPIELCGAFLPSVCPAARLPLLVVQCLSLIAFIVLLFLYYHKKG